ncbi:MAG: HAMP domain-containing sensor histidine kinase [Bacteroidota bacterium]
MKTQNKLYWKISFALLSLLFLLGICYVLITASTAQKHFGEVNQKLYRGVAEHLVQETHPLKNGVPDTAATHDIMHSMMVINPSVEVYLLDTEGRILDYVVPYKTVVRKQVDLAPIQTFLAKQDNLEACIMGDDPKHEQLKKTFSAAPIYEDSILVEVGGRKTYQDSVLTGYAYVILASEEQAAVASTLLGNYMFRAGTSSFLITLLGALGIGLLALWFLTKNLRQIIDTVRRFKEGDYAARIPENAKGDFTILADTYNEMADQIVANIEQIKSIDQFRQELIANVSHDLRTPLAIMQGYVETLIMKSDNLSKEDRKKYLEIVMDSSVKLSKLVSQLFEYSKLEANQIEPQKEAFFIGELAQDVYAKYQILAQDKQIKLNLNASQDLPLVFADVGLVERVLQNLMDNALKFTPKNGAVTIQLAADHEHVEIKISDSGPGIPKEKQSYIFDRYRRSEVDSNKGAGLGLAIVKKILEIHNSTIQVISKPNEGATFWFQLPAYQTSIG